jgi:hypothetical protein
MDGRTGRRNFHVRLYAVALVTIIGTLAAEARAEFISFLVAERPGRVTHGDSFVLRLSNPDEIAHARELIVRGPDVGGAIILARIAPGADGINRDYRAPGAPPWSWHVTEFLGFADFSAELYDGWPTFVERNVPGWMANTGGTIGFWNYTVIAELPAVPEPSGLVLFGTGATGLLVCGAWCRRRQTMKRDGLTPGSGWPRVCTRMGTWITRLGTGCARRGCGLANVALRPVVLWLVGAVGFRGGRWDQPQLAEPQAQSLAGDAQEA